MRTGVITMVLAAAGLLAAVAALGPATGQHMHGSGGPAPAASGSAATGPAAAGLASKSVRLTMEALHAAGGTPPGWRFTLPAGDPAAGRRAFVDFKCFACHAIQGEQFPLEPGQVATAGPELTGMGGHHPAEYLAESIVNPSAVLVDAPGFIGGDGRSIMPETPDMTIRQLSDLVAYLKSQSGGHDHGPAGSALERVSGGYRVRLVYRAAPEAEHSHGGHGAHAGHGAPAPKAGGARLMAFVAATDSNQPVPYLPVTARIDAAGKPPRSVKLVPALGPEGFHYGAEVAVAPETRRIILSIGPATMRVLPGVGAGVGRATTVAFDWGGGQ